MVSSLTRCMEICVVLSVLFLLCRRLKFEEETSKMLRWSMALYGAETWTLRAAEQKHLESSEM